MRYKIMVWFVVFLLGVDVGGLLSKDDFPILKGPYLGQKPPGMTPKVFAPGIVSTNATEGSSSFSKDGQFYLFARARAALEGILIMEKIGGIWQKPRIAPFSAGRHDWDFMLAPDGKYVLVASGRPALNEKSPVRDHRIWISERSDKSWSKPQLLPFPVNSGQHDSYPSVSVDHTLYFFSRREGGIGNGDIYRSKFTNGKYVEVENLGAPINTQHHEVDPFIAPDESFLIFCSDRPGGYGEEDIYITFRKENRTWSNPINMGEKINSPYQEYIPYITPDGKYFFFTTNKSGNRDILWVDAKIIDKLKPKGIKNPLSRKLPKDVIQISKLTGNIYKIDQNPFNNFVHLASIGDDGILLIDTAFKDTGEELLRKLKKFDKSNIRYVVNTHIHEDHIGSNGLFAEEALIISHSNTRDRFFKPYYFLPPIDLAGIPVLTFENTLNIYFNGEKVILKHVKSGHTDGDVTVYFPDSKVLYIGDLIIHNRFSTVDLSKGGDINGFIKNLESLIKDYPDNVRFIPAHGPEYNKKMLRVYHDAFVRTAPLIEAQLIAGKTVSEIVNSDVFKKYKNWERKKDWIKVIKTRLDGKTIPSICEVMTKIFVQKGLIAAIKEYHYLRKHYPDKYNFDERQLNNLGYALLDRKMIQEAISVFELNIQIYPKISNAYDNLAEAYMINGEKGKAIWSYKKSLKLNPSNQITRDRLKELYKKK